MEANHLFLGNQPQTKYMKVNYIINVRDLCFINGKTMVCPLSVKISQLGATCNAMKHGAYR